MHTLRYLITEMDDVHANTQITTGNCCRRTHFNATVLYNDYGFGLDVLQVCLSLFLFSVCLSMSLFISLSLFALS